jgi:hypothetical protein
LHTLQGSTIRSLPFTPAHALQFFTLIASPRW